jgi:molecular chaperone DnaJ
MGTTKKIAVSLDRACTHCKQSGAESTSDIVTCSNCGGQGVVEVVQRTILGAIRTQTDCSSCQGKGKVIKRKCRTCQGKKFSTVKEVIELTIPRGIYPHKRLRYRERGNDG